MDQLLELLHGVMPVLYVLSILAVIGKVVLVTVNKRFDFAAILISFFRIYSSNQLATSNSKRRVYMRINNLINYYLYVFLFLFVVLFIVFQKNMFTY